MAFTRSWVQIPSAPVLIIFSIFFSSCGGEKPSNFLRVYKNQIVDPQNRIVILRGVNFSERSKYPPFLPGLTKNGEFFEASTDVISQIKSWGMNSVRFLIIWEAIEPEPFLYNIEYLQKVESWVMKFAEEEMFVILDMHQDLYSRYFGGDGAPFWAVDKTVPYEPFDIWYINYLNPAVMRNWDIFWESEELQNHYALVWKLVAEIFKDNPFVAGYEIMNEPFGGSKNMLLTEFETEYLLPFYKKVIRKIREVDKNHIIFIEPSILKGGGLRSFLRNPGDDNVVYFPHYYDPTVLWVHPYDGNKLRAYNAFLSMKEEAERNNFALAIGEWGILLYTQNSKEYIEDHMKIFDELKLGWFFWDYNLEDWDFMSPVMSDLSPRCFNNYCFLHSLKRPNPSRIAGNVDSISYNYETRQFSLCFFNSPDIYSNETEILFPPDLYPEIKISVSDGSYRISDGKVLYYHAVEENHHCLFIK